MARGTVRSNRRAQIAVALGEAVDLLFGLAAALGQQDLGGLNGRGVQGRKAVEGVGGAEGLHDPLHLQLRSGQQLHKARKRAWFHRCHSVKIPFCGMGIWGLVRSRCVGAACMAARGALASYGRPPDNAAWVRAAMYAAPTPFLQKNILPSRTSHGTRVCRAYFVVPPTFGESSPSHAGRRRRAWLGGCPSRGALCRRLAAWASLSGASHRGTPPASWPEKSAQRALGADHLAPVQVAALEAENQHLRGGQIGGAGGRYSCRTGEWSA